MRTPCALCSPVSVSLYCLGRQHAMSDIASDLDVLLPHTAIVSDLDVFLPHTADISSDLDVFFAPHS
ncbi:hypothetical protein RRG08_021565 [Elysia crispata]|uniref:Uncharacterized protein n=1 Tax=Elysia crispata TaxID=231223 RepID=A0AAE1CEM1_9GAST|nr:hypothetical protein RRG08_021565 [Elysia crispata]